MKQKTVYTTIRRSVGDTVLLVGREYHGKERYYLYGGMLAKDGYPGNANKYVCRFHGWRGCTNDINVYAYGVREVKSVTNTGNVDVYGNTLYKIVVGADLHPDWE